MKRTALIAVLVVALVFGVVGYAFAGTDTFVSGGGAGNKTVDNSGNLVQVQATINPKLSLKITTPDGAGTSLLVDFGAVDPGVVSAAKTVNLTVRSNRDFTVATTKGGADYVALGLATSIVPTDVYTKADTQTINDSYTLNPDYSLAADGTVYHATVQYTVAQQ